MPVQFFARRGIYYGWVIIAVMFVTLFFVLGLRFSFGIFYVAILEETGWTRADTAAIFSIAMGVYGLTTVLSGALFDRFGPRRVFPAGILLLTVGLVLCSRIETIFELYLYYGVIVGFAFSLLGFPTHMAVVPRWFQRRRGLASAAALSGVGAGSLVLTLGSEHLISLIGWRSSYLVFGLLVLCVALPLNLFLHRDSPRDAGVAPEDGVVARPEVDRPNSGQAFSLSASPPPDFTILSAARTPEFWLVFLAVTMVGFIGMTIVVHQTQLSMDFGYSLGLSSTMFGALGIARAVGQLTWGPLSDRFGLPRIFILVTLFGLAGMGCLVLARFDAQPLYLLAFVSLFGFGHMGMSPVYASTVAELFPGRHMGKILGTLDIGFGLGSSSGPWLAGWLFDRYGNYDITLTMLMGAILITGLALLQATKLRSPVR